MACCREIPYTSIVYGKYGHMNNYSARTDFKNVFKKKITMCNISN